MSSVKHTVSPRNLGLVIDLSRSEHRPKQWVIASASSSPEPRAISQATENRMDRMNSSGSNQRCKVDICRTDSVLSPSTTGACLVCSTVFAGSSSRPGGTDRRPRVPCRWHSVLIGRLRRGRLPFHFGMQLNSSFNCIQVLLTQRVF